MTPSEQEQAIAPDLHETVHVAEGARIYGDVIIGKQSSVWFNAVLRADEGRIAIGKGTNIQDNVVIHSDLGTGAWIGDSVTIGHGAIIRGCRIEENVMVGMNATVMTHAHIGKDSMVGANALVPYYKTFPERSLITGVPARWVRYLTDDEVAFNRTAVDAYLKLVERYAAKKIRAWPGHQP
ncbi:MAG: gamma carbonic anhydrase family protein [Thermodesulfobacteriota bacterium]